MIILIVAQTFGRSFIWYKNSRGPRVVHLDTLEVTETWLVFSPSSTIFTVREGL